MLAGRDAEGNFAWDAYDGLMKDRVETLTPSRLLIDRVRSSYITKTSTDRTNLYKEMDYYVEKFAQHGLKAPCKAPL